jgi:hypothetical protein
MLAMMLMSSDENSATLLMFNFGGTRRGLWEDNNVRLDYGDDGGGERERGVVVNWRNVTRGEFCGHNGMPHCTSTG